MQSTLSTSRKVTIPPRSFRRLGILGCGGFMRRVYSPLLQSAAARAQVVALCDVQSDNLRVAGLLFPSARQYAKPEVMLASEDLDAVVVLTAEAANADSATLALRAGLPVYLEKPPALTASEFAALRAEEEESGAPLFVAFNRRHTPLMRGFQPPRSLLRVHGCMERLNRPVSTFPYTALHLIDSLLFFSGSTPSLLSIEFASAKFSRWTLRGQWDTGAICELEIVPDGGEHREYLVFEGEDETVEIQFPNPESLFPVGRLARVSDSHAAESVHGSRIDALHEMGYAPAFRGFLDHLENGRDPASTYRLSSCEDALAIMAAMKQDEAAELSFTVDVS